MAAAIIAAQSASKFGHKGQKIGLAGVLVRQTSQNAFLPVVGWGRHCNTP
jgi:hypothetical protein